MLLKLKILGSPQIFKLNDIKGCLFKTVVIEITTKFKMNILAIFNLIIIKLFTNIICKCNRV